MAYPSTTPLWTNGIQGSPWTTCTRDLSVAEDACAAIVLVGTAAGVTALPAPSLLAIMLAYLQSPTLPALAPDPIMLAYLRSPTLDALAPDPIMLAYLRSPTLPALALPAIMLAYLRSPTLSAQH